MLHAVLMQKKAADSRRNWWKFCRIILLNAAAAEKSTEFKRRCDMPVTFEGKVISCGRQEGKLFWLPDPPVRVAVLKTEFVDAEVIHFKTVLSAAKEKLEKQSIRF